MPSSIFFYNPGQNRRLKQNKKQNQLVVFMAAGGWFWFAAELHLITDKIPAIFSSKFRHPAHGQAASAVGTTLLQRRGAPGGACAGRAPFA
jgi:hypothetical protein